MRPCYHGPRLPPKWKVSNRGSLYRLASHPSNLRTESRVTHIPRQGDRVRGPIYIAGSCQEGKPFQQEELFEKVRQHLPSSPSRAQIMYSGASFDASKKATPGAKPGFSVDKLTVSFLPQILTAEK